LNKEQEITDKNV